MVALYELMDLLPNNFDPQLRPKLKELFFFLKKSEKMEEQEAAVAFLGRNKKHFNKLKNELKDILCAYIITNPSTWVDNEHKALYDKVYKSFATYKILLTGGNRSSAIERAKPLFSKLCKLELHALTYAVAQDLHYHYSVFETMPKLAREYGHQVDRQSELIQAETIVRRCHSRMGLICNTRNNFPASVVEELETLMNACKPFLALNSKSLNRYIYNTIIARYIVTYDYQKVLFYCKAALASFSTDNPNYNVIRFDLLQKSIPALVATGQLRQAKDIAKEIGQMMPVGKFNWQVALIRRVSICLHKGDYQEAYDLLKARIKHKSSYRILQEYWKVLEGYIYFLIQTGHIDTYTDERFSLGKFLNEVPLYSRDKAGNNINVLILQIIIRMQRGEYGIIIDRIDSLREYVRNYTRNPETKRANIFINMILKMESASFHRVATERKTKLLLKKLKNTPLALGQNLNIEIIPYPKLWEEILHLLDNKFHGLKLRKSRKKHS